MKYLYLIFVLCPILISCKKDVSIDFPKGKYSLIAYDVENVCNFRTYFENKNLIQNTFEVDSKDNLVFTSDKGVEKFRILSCNKINKETFFNINGFYSIKHYQLIVRNNFKKFSFKYYEINDTIVYGVFWEKNQSYYSSVKPNVARCSCSSITNFSDLDAYEYSSETKVFANNELFGVFKKM